MNIKDLYLDAVAELGYTKTEARFVYIVGTHSGYFTAQQYLDFAGAKRGYRSDALSRKLLTNKHATAEIYRKNARVYHLFSRRFYSAIGKENVRNRREHEFQFIKTRALSVPREGSAGIADGAGNPSVFSGADAVGIAAVCRPEDRGCCVSQRSYAPLWR